jgi:hypothetical protein
VFAFKYWALAIKVEKIKNNQDPNKINTCLVIVLIFGIITNLTTDVCFALGYSQKLSAQSRKRFTIAALAF